MNKPGPQTDKARGEGRDGSNGSDLVAANVVARKVGKRFDRRLAK